MSKRIAVCMVAGLSLAILPLGLQAGRIEGLPDGQPSTQPMVRTGPQITRVTLSPGTSQTISTTPSPATQPTTAPAISLDARALIDQTAEAYRKLKSLELAGVLKIDEAGNGEQEKHSVDFTDAVAGHGRFRHEGKEDAVAGANEKMQYFYANDTQEYKTGPAATPGADIDDLIDPLPDYLRNCDTSLVLALSDQPAKILLEDIASATRGPDTTLDSQSYPTLKLISSDKTEDTLLLDPTTHLLRQVQVDMKPALVAQGQTVDHFLITIDYTSTTPNAAIKPDAMDWSPPAGSQEMPDPAGPVMQLRGKPAPDFALAYLDGKPVSLRDFKGSVVVLDFWATWCGPCVQSLPGLDALYQRNKADGLRVLAIDAGEASADMKDFVDKTKLGLPVVMDPDSKARDAYQIQAYPTKIVIDKDGTVSTVLVGAGPAAERKLQKAVDAAMAK